MEGGPGGNGDGGLRQWQSHGGGGLIVVPGQVMGERPLEHAVDGVECQPRVEGDVGGSTHACQAINAQIMSEFGHDHSKEDMASLTQTWF